jgi:hypothetical protein
MYHLRPSFGTGVRIGEPSSHVDLYRDLSSLTSKQVSDFPRSRPTYKSRFASLESKEEKKECTRINEHTSQGFYYCSQSDSHNEIMEAVFLSTHT